MTTETQRTYSIVYQASKNLILEGKCQAKVKTMVKYERENNMLLMINILQLNKVFSMGLLFFFTIFF